jgi:hypothetical protein
MKTWIVTVRMLRKNPAHNPQAKVSGPCPVSGFCTDVTGEHHSFVVLRLGAEAEVRELVARHGAAGGYRLTRIEEAGEYQV